MSRKLRPIVPRERRGNVKMKVAAPRVDSNSILLEQLASLPTLEAYKLERTTLALLLNQAVKDLINSPPEDHDRKTLLQGVCQAYERALGMNGFMQKKLRDEIKARAVQAPGQEGAA